MLDKRAVYARSVAACQAENAGVSDVVVLVHEDNVRRRLATAGSINTTGRRRLTPVEHYRAKIEAQHPTHVVRVFTLHGTRLREARGHDAS